MPMKSIVAAIAIAASLFLPARADDKQPTPKEMEAIKKAFKAIGELQYRSGEVSLAGGKVKLTLPPEFQYLVRRTRERCSWIFSGIHRSRAARTG